MKNPMRALAASLKSWPTTRYCLFVGATGFALLLAGSMFVGGTGWGKDLFGPGATLMTVALTGYIAIRGVVTWAEQRDRDRETAEYLHREAVYEEIVVFMLGQFGIGAYDEAKDSALRAKAALWGSTDTIQALSNWQSMLSLLLASRPQDGDGIFHLLPMEKMMLKALFGAAVLAMRNDLAPNTVGQLKDVDMILDSMFNDR